MKRVAMLLVDLETPSEAGWEPPLSVALNRWAQEVRFSTLVEARGVIVGDVTGTVVEGTAADFVEALKALRGGARGD